MYHCDIKFYLIGNSCKEFEVIKRMAPMYNFTHKFYELRSADGIELTDTDVVLAKLEENEIIANLNLLVLAKQKETQLILLLDKGYDITALKNYLSELTDIWYLPMTTEEMEFRFLKWQERYKTEKDLWQESQFLKTTINSVPNLIWYKDKVGIHHIVNQAFCTAVNKTNEQVVGQKHGYIWGTGEDDPACIESDNMVMDSGQTITLEENVLTSEGSREMVVYKSPLLDLDGTPMGTVGVGIDVTQEHLYRKEIMAKADNLENIFTSLECGILRHSIDGRHVLNINQAALDILGYTCKDELELDGFDMVANSVLDEDKPILKTAIRGLRKEGDSATVEYRVRHKTGEINYVLGNIKLIKENGKFLYQRFLLDTTAQKLKEKKEEKYYLEMIQALSIGYDMICFFDINSGKGRPIQINEENEYKFGYIFSDDDMPLDDSIELYMERFVYKDDRTMFSDFFNLDTMMNRLRKGKVQYLNYRTMIYDKMEYFQVKVVYVDTWNGGDGLVVGFRCIDEEMQSEMKQKNILEDALSQAQKANVAKSTFLSNMSHDIRTPMNAIIGFTSLAITHMDNPDVVKEYLNKILSSGHHMLNLINNVLDMSCIENGKMTMYESLCSLRGMLNDIYNLVQVDITNKNLEFTITTEGVYNDKIYCDNLRLNQVLLNIIGNAIKYTNPGGNITVTVLEKATELPKYGKYMFTIKDTGIGMSKSFLKRIFIPFERENNTTHSKVAGTGLGMAITKNIVDMMNGTIDISSREGYGTEVNLTFVFRTDMEEDVIKTVAALEAADDVSENTENLSSGVEEFDPVNYRILLVEDNELNQEIAKELLEETGFKVEVADNGQIAVDMLRSSEPGYFDVVLMDIQMPVMNGYEATRTIRSLNNRDIANIPILAVTANAFSEDKQEALRSGMNDHIPKPIDVNTLMTVLKRVLLGGG